MFKAWKRFGTRPDPVEVIDVIPVLNRSLAYRRFLRSVFQAPARLNLAGHMRDVQVLDVSLKGALVDMGVVAPCPVGVRGRLRLQLSPACLIAMDVVVTRVHGSQLGLQCLHIDLDSVTHLRQLIERNSQDPTLLARELSMLVGSSV